MTDRTDSIKKKILVVEDEPGISNVCLRVLTEEGFEVAIAENGQIAKDMIAESRYQLCLIDIRTPVMNGQELFQYIKENNVELAGRVVFTTGDLIGGDTQTFLKETGRLFLPKPFTPGELRTVVREALRQAGG
jgi:DNA-binding response OmpR family regulator